MYPSSHEMRKNELCNHAICLITSLENSSLNKSVFRPQFMSSFWTPINNTDERLSPDKVLLLSVTNQKKKQKKQLMGQNMRNEQAKKAFIKVSYIIKHLRRSVTHMK